jgi:hypothetical protein
MADNTTLNPGAGGDVIASDDIGGVKYQRTKVTFGVDGAATDASSTNPLPTSAPDGSPDADRMDLMLYFLGAILEKLPTPDSSDRMRINLETGSHTNFSVAGISNNSTGSIVPLMLMPWNQSDSGSSRIYDQVLFS